MGWFNDFTNKYPFTNFHELNLSWFLEEFIRLKEEVKNFYIDFAKRIDEEVNKWLDEHPEATTTVLDGSLTYKKLVTGTLGFVTPEMYGAVGDGVTDDTIAINDAINSGSKRIEFSNKTYLVTKMPASEVYPDNDQPCISIHNIDGLTLNGNGAILKCNNHGQGIIEINNSKNITVNDFELSGFGTFPPISPDGRGEKGSANGGYYTAGYDWESHKNNSVNTSGFTGVNGDPLAPWGTFGNGYIGNAGIGLLIENGSENINIYNVVSHGFNYSGISVGFRGHEDYPISKNISINNCTCYNMYDNGINVFLSENVNIDGNKIYEIGHPDARPVNPVSVSAYTYQDPGYGITLRKPNNETSKANHTNITNNFISKCVRKGIDSHSSNNTVVDGNNISLCYVAGIENSNSVSPETWTTNMKITNNILTWCGAYGNAISVQTVTNGSADIAPSDYPYNIDIIGNTLKECSCSTNGIIYIRCGKGINVADNIISGSWSIKTLAGMSAIRVGQSEMPTNGVNVINNRMFLDDLTYLIFCTDLNNGNVSGNIGKAETVLAVLVVTGDCVISDNDLRATTSSGSPSFTANIGKTTNNILTGSTRGFKLLHGDYTITNGAVVVSDTFIQTYTRAFIQHEYSSSQGLTVDSTVQVQEGRVIVYLRDNTAAQPTGTITLNVLLINDR